MALFTAVLGVPDLVPSKATKLVSIANAFTLYLVESASANRPSVPVLPPDDT